MTWERQLDESVKGRYDMILVRDLLISLLFYLKLSKNIITGGGRTFEGCTTLMIDLSTHDYN